MKIVGNVPMHSRFERLIELEESMGSITTSVFAKCGRLLFFCLGLLAVTAMESEMKVRNYRVDKV